MAFYVLHKPPVHSTTYCTKLPSQVGTRAELELFLRIWREHDPNELIKEVPESCVLKVFGPDPNDRPWPFDPKW